MTSSSENSLCPLLRSDCCSPSSCAMTVELSWQGNDVLVQSNVCMMKILRALLDTTEEQYSTGIFPTSLLPNSRQLNSIRQNSKRTSAVLILPGKRGSDPSQNFISSVVARLLSEGKSKHTKQRRAKSKGKKHKDKKSLKYLTQ